MNPFEKNSRILSGQPLWSPSIFKANPTTPPPKKRCDWSIDEISKLNPVNIEDSPSSHQNTEQFSESTEANFQANSYTFFINNPLPSPVHDDVARSRMDADAFRRPNSAEVQSDNEKSDSMEISLPRRTLQFSFDDSTASISSEDSGCFQPWVIHGAMIMSPNANVQIPSTRTSSQRNNSSPENKVTCSTPTPMQQE